MFGELLDRRVEYRRETRERAIFAGRRCCSALSSMDVQLACTHTDVEVKSRSVDGGVGARRVRMRAALKGEEYKKGV